MNSDNKDPVHVFCRIRPIEEGSEPTNCIKIVAADTVTLTTPVIRKEKFRHIFSAFSSQSELFTHVAYPLLIDLLSAKNGLLFTYGVSGSGKTYTLTGNQNDPGIIPKCINTIFNTIGDFQVPKCVIKSDRMNGFEVQSEDDAVQDRLHAVRNFPKTPKSQRKGNRDRVPFVNDGTIIHNINENNLYSVFVSYVEIYNNSVFDLLDESSGETLQNKILREDCHKNMYVHGAVEVEVKSTQEAFEIFTAGQIRKKMATTSLNTGSHRSHSIFNIRIVQLEQGTHENLIKVGQLSLVDLAGSERTNRSNNTGMRLKEASSINNSLMSLRACLEILRENQLNNGNRLVPYRDSRLTYFFKHYFEGDGSVKMIVCINPTMEDLEENMQVLKFAEMMQDVKITRADVKYAPLKNTVTKNRFKAKQIDKEIDEKQSELRKKPISTNQECVPGPSKAEMKSLKTVIHKEKQKSRNLQIKMSELETAKHETQSKQKCGTSGCDTVSEKYNQRKGP